MITYTIQIREKSSGGWVHRVIAQGPKEDDVRVLGFIALDELHANPVEAAMKAADVIAEDRANGRAQG